MYLCVCVCACVDLYDGRHHRDITELPALPTVILASLGLRVCFHSNPTSHSPPPFCCMGTTSPLAEPCMAYQIKSNLICHMCRIQQVGRLLSATLGKERRITCFTVKYPTSPLHYSNRTSLSIIPPSSIVLGPPGILVAARPYITLYCDVNK